MAGEGNFAEDGSFLPVLLPNLDKSESEFQKNIKS